MSIELVMPFNHLILCCPLLLLPSIFPSLRIFSNESALIKWPNIGASASASVLTMNIRGWFPLELIGLITLQETLKSVLQHHSLKASVFGTQIYGPTIISIHGYWKSCATFATPWTVACQALLFMEFFRQEYWSGLPFSTPGPSSPPRDWTHVSCVSCTGRRILYHWDTWGAHVICTHTQILGMEMRKRKVGVVKEVLCPGKQRVEKLRQIIFAAVGLQTD